MYMKHQKCVSSDVNGGTASCWWETMFTNSYRLLENGQIGPKTEINPKLEIYNNAEPACCHFQNTERERRNILLSLK